MNTETCIVASTFGSIYLFFYVNYVGVIILCAVEEYY